MIRNTILLTAAALALMVTEAPAETERNALDYIPPGQFVSGWEATGNEFVGSADRSGFLIGDLVPVAQEYDLVWFATETYARGQDEMSVEIFEFPSGSDAYGFYSISHIDPSIPPDAEVRSTEYDPAPPVEFGIVRRAGNNEKEWLEGYKDRFYFRILIAEEELNDSGIRAGLYLLANLPGASIEADMISILPAGDLVWGTQRYIRGPVGLSRIAATDGDDIFGFDEYTWRAAAGEYRLGGGSYYLLAIAEYEDEDTCEQAADRLKDWFTDAGWETVIVEPLRNGAHPRAFVSETCAAFWPDRDHLWLLWNLEDQDELTRALARF